VGAWLIRLRGACCGGCTLLSAAVSTPRGFRNRALRSYFAPSQSQQGWAAAGLAILVLIAAVASANFRDIYAAQKDFVVGSLLSLVGFCFGKALSRTEERRALELIRTTPTPAVTALLSDETTRRLDRDGVFRQLAVLARNAGAAQSRLSEYYDSRCSDLDFYRHEPHLRIVLDDLDRVGATVADLGEILHVPAAEARFSIPPTVKLALTGVRRDLREAIARRDQAYEWFHGRLAPEASAAWDLFAVMTSDMLKAARGLDAVLAQYVPFPPRELTHTAVGYLNAALHRASEFNEAVMAYEVEQPKIFKVMLADMSAAIGILQEVEQGLPVIETGSTSAQQPLLDTQEIEQLPDQSRAGLTVTDRRP
jgi:hypothetical protein